MSHMITPNETYSYHTCVNSKGRGMRATAWHQSVHRIKAYLAALQPVGLGGKSAPPTASSSLQLPGERRPSQSSLSVAPGGQYAVEEAADSLRRKLCNTMHAPMYAFMLPSFALMGRRSILHLCARIPKVFSMTRRALVIL